MVRQKRWMMKVGEENNFYRLLCILWMVLGTKLTGVVA